MIFSRDILVGIAVALLIALGVGGFNYWKRYQEERLDRVAELVYLYEKGKLRKEEVEPKVKGTPLYPYFLSLTGASPSDIVAHLKDEDLKKLFSEKEAFAYYVQKKYDRALNKLSLIGKGDFNYPSALLLKAFVYEDKGEKKEALSLYGDIIKSYAGSYFARIARARLYTLRNP